MSSATYNAANQLTQWGTASLTYDLNGNLTNDGTSSYTWSARNQLAAVGSSGFAYDSFGRRTQNAAGTGFLYDGVNPIQELSGSTAIANLLTSPFIDEVLSRTDSSGTSSFLSDGVGSTVALTGSSGTVQTQYTYEPFGKTSSSGSSSGNKFQFTGRENDGTGLYYYRARYYSPALQRFISEDPIRAGGNFYEYANGNPVLFVDPLGLDATNWFNSSGGRPLYNGPTNGNWGGKNWSGGWYPPGHGGKDGTLPPLDSGDEAYQRHDQCYSGVPLSPRYSKNRCDDQLVKELRELPDDSSQWNRPPRKGTKDDSENFRDNAIWYFGPLVSRPVNMGKCPTGVCGIQ